MSKERNTPAWIARGKTIGELIKELQSFGDQDLPVMISTDNGDTQRIINLVMKSDGACLLLNAQEQERG